MLDQLTTLGIQCGMP